MSDEPIQLDDGAVSMKPIAPGPAVSYPSDKAMTAEEVYAALAGRTIERAEPLDRWPGRHPWDGSVRFHFTDGTHVDMEATYYDGSLIMPNTSWEKDE